ncbi:hypothetical protein KAU51_02540 [Candidatus Parcubacteria bacterium]|nr:hypothetical protein [Candidatus Parcubacteria bacterium]
MAWLSIIISAYFLLAVCALIDKYLLTGPIPHPRVYAFYVGILGILVLFLIPFIDFYIPELALILLSFLAGAVFVLALFWLYKSLHLFEASRVIPVIGGLSPFFVIILIYIFSWGLPPHQIFSSGGEEILSPSKIAAFIFLVLGSVLITFKKDAFITLKVLRYSLLTAFLFSLSIVLAKYVYLSLPFWNGYIWIRIGGVFAAFVFLFLSSELREKIFKPRVSMISFFSTLGYKIRTTGIFLFNKGIGAMANILQNWAIALAPLGYLAIINALQGTQYVFLLILAVLICFKYPKILKEEISKEIIFQKTIAILSIGAGLVILSFL